MTLFCDLDGVLADFDNGVKAVTDHYPHELPIGKMWKALANADDFYYNLEFMHDALELWEFIAPYNPVILTGLPMGKWAPGQKKRWVGDKLGWDVPIITCMARDKHTYAEPGDILIDDRLKAKEPWLSVGGVFVHHTSAVETIAELKSYGY